MCLPLGAGLVTKIKKVQYAPLPSGYTPEWAEMVRSMLRKEPSERPSISELRKLPFMQQAFGEAEERAGAPPVPSLPALRPPIKFSAPDCSPPLLPRRSPCAAVTAPRAAVAFTGVRPQTPLRFCAVPWLSHLLCRVLLLCSGPVWRLGSSQAPLLTRAGQRTQRTWN